MKKAIGIALLAAFLVSMSGCANTERQTAEERTVSESSFIYQDYGIIDDETVSFNVSLKKFGNNQGQIKEVLEIVGLQGREKDKSLVLSCGEKQRLGIARAILKNASVIFADEPTASLDNSNRQLVVSLLKDCANRGAAIILATHDERLVAECDTVVRLGT